MFSSLTEREMLGRNWEEIPIFPPLIAVMWGYFVGVTAAIMWAWEEARFYNQHSGILELPNHHCYHLLLAFLLCDQEKKKKKKKKKLPLLSKLLLGILLITAKVISNDIPWHETFTNWMAKGNLIVVVQSPSHVWVFKTPWAAACQASLFLTISWSLASLIGSNYTLLWIHVVICFSRWHCLRIRNLSLNFFGNGCDIIKSIQNLAPDKLGLESEFC